jgi:hypothetical protein
MEHDSQVPKDNDSAEVSTGHAGLYTLLVFLLILVSGLLGVWYHYYAVKAYDFTVEAPCDETATTCFVRDCESGDGCPPNGLAEYRVFHLMAADFESCSDDTCLAEITSGQIQAEEEICEESEESACVTTE